MPASSIRQPKSCKRLKAELRVRLQGLQSVAYTSHLKPSRTHARQRLHEPLAAADGQHTSNEA